MSGRLQDACPEPRDLLPGGSCTTLHRAVAPRGCTTLHRMDPARWLNRIAN